MARWSPHPQSAGDIFGNAGWCLLDRFPSSYLDEFTPDLIGVGRQLKRKWLGRLKKSHPAAADVSNTTQPAPAP